MSADPHAGVESSSTTVAFAMLLLAQHPASYQQAQREVDSATRIADGAVSFSAGDMQQMPFLAACVKETLRLYPPAPFTARMATEDVSVNGQSIAKGDVCFMNHYSTHMHEDFWPAHQVQFKTSAKEFR